MSLFSLNWVHTKVVYGDKYFGKKLQFVYRDDMQAGRDLIEKWLKAELTSNPVLGFDWFTMCDYRQEW